MRFIALSLFSFYLPNFMHIGGSIIVATNDKVGRFLIHNVAILVPDVMLKVSQNLSCLHVDMHHAAIHFSPLSTTNTFMKCILLYCIVVCFLRTCTYSSYGWVQQSLVNDFLESCDSSQCLITLQFLCWISENICTALVSVWSVIAGACCSRVLGSVFASFMHVRVIMVPNCQSVRWSLCQWNVRWLGIVQFVNFILLQVCILNLQLYSTCKYCNICKLCGALHVVWTVKDISTEYLMWW